MTFGVGPANALSSYLPVEFQIPEDEDFFRELIAKRERLTASIINIKENANYEKEELLTAQQWFDTVSPSINSPLKARYSFRKVFDLVALNGGVAIPPGPSAFPHGITGIVTPTRIFGTATSAGPVYLPLPFAGAAGNNIEIFFDNVNVNINNNYGAALTQCYVVFEYLKQ
jgi:hypothetical protein